MGHTAAGKSQIVEAVAERFGAHVLSVDSMQVYRGMDIGTAKPSKAVRAALPHHMVDVVDSSDEYDVVRFQRDSRSVIKDLGPTERLIIAGGSGLHFRAIVDPLSFAPTDAAVRAEIEASGDAATRKAALLKADPDAGSHVDLSNDRRVVRALEVWRLTGQTPTERATIPEAEDVRRYTPKIPHLALGVDAADSAHDRVNARFDRMVETGLMAEVESLSTRLSRSASQAVGYKELLAVVRGESSLPEAAEEAKRATRGLVKRQRTYFKRDPRIVWMTWQDDGKRRIDAVAGHIERETAWTS